MEEQIKEETMVENENQADTKPQDDRFSNAEQKAQELSDKISKGSIFFPIGGIISGVLSVLFGLIVGGKHPGNYAASFEYGGDAYTGIQNAAATTANNIRSLAYIVRGGFSFLLIALGLIAIFYFAMKLSQKK